MNGGDINKKIKMSLFILGMTKFTNKPNKDGGLGFSIWSLFGDFFFFWHFESWILLANQIYSFFSTPGSSFPWI